MLWGSHSGGDWWSWTSSDSGSWTSSDTTEEDTTEETTNVIEADPLHIHFVDVEDGHPQEDEEYLLCPTCGSPYCGGCD